MQFRVRLAAPVVAAVISALSLAAVVATPASAASASGVTYHGSSLCVRGTVIVVPYAYWGAWPYPGYVSASAGAYYPGCSQPRAVPYGDLATQAEVYKWGGSSWVYCTSSGWVYGGGVTASLLPAAAYAQAKSGTCGPGWYGAYGWSLVWGDDQGTYKWYGGLVWTGAEYIPVTVTTGAVAMTPSKQSQAAARPGGASFDKLPAETPVVNHAGQLVTDAHGNLETHRTGVSQPPVQGTR